MIRSYGRAEEPGGARADQDQNRPGRRGDRRCGRLHDQVPARGERPRGPPTQGAPATATTAAVSSRGRARAGLWTRTDSSPPPPRRPW